MVRPSNITFGRHKGSVVLLLNPYTLTHEDHSYLKDFANSHAGKHYNAYLHIHVCCILVAREKYCKHYIQKQ